ncbi:MAG TPA: YeeE/YedE thiosulfate transporter family protein [Anaeromyxobacteraceae bacterium]|nr:YeeE/YedE thiosulfate transporter family protein [Anaeromyxobacteraceae bacterium]
MSDSTERRTPKPLDWRVAGILLGLLGVLAVALQGPIGVSTAYVTTEAAAVAAVSPEAAQANAYWKKIGTSLTAEWVLVIGMVVGGVAASILSGSRTREAVPQRWRERFGARNGARFAGAFAGGFLILFGARLAGGCTSGHVISGMQQLALSGVVFAAGVFVTGIPVARMLYGRNS